MKAKESDLLGHPLCVYCPGREWYGAPGLGKSVSPQVALYGSVVGGSGDS